MSEAIRISRGTLVIDVDACKGCDLCLDACKPGVLVMTDEKRNRKGSKAHADSEGEPSVLLGA